MCCITLLGRGGNHRDWGLSIGRSVYCINFPFDKFDLRRACGTGDTAKAGEGAQALLSRPVCTRCRLRLGSRLLLGTHPGCSASPSFPPPTNTHHAPYRPSQTCSMKARYKAALRVPSRNKSSLHASSEVPPQPSVPSECGDATCTNHLYRQWRHEQRVGARMAEEWMGEPMSLGNSSPHSYHARALTHCTAIESPRSKGCSLAARGRLHRGRFPGRLLRPRRDPNLCRHPKRTAPSATQEQRYQE